MRMTGCGAEQALRDGESGFIEESENGRKQQCRFADANFCNEALTGNSAIHYWL